MVEYEKPSRKRLFIGLLCGTGLTVCALLALLWLIPYVGLANIHPLAPWVLGVTFAVIMPGAPCGTATSDSLSPDRAFRSSATG